MNSSDLVRMANQVAEFWAPYGRDEAAKNVAIHLRSFWDPRMRRQIYAHLDAGGAGLLPDARTGVTRMRESDPVATETAPPPIV